MKQILLLAAQCIFAGHLTAAESPVFFRVTFDGNTNATLAAKHLVPASAPQVSYVDSDHDQALHLTKDETIDYDLGEGFPSHTGSLEIRFKPAFPQDHPAFFCRDRWIFIWQHCRTRRFPPDPRGA